jgi:ElaB/YqjD/DUF883 family membrane-anchored ribosome-binding protein
MTEPAKSTEKPVTDLRRVASHSRQLLHDSPTAASGKAKALGERLEETLESEKATCRQLGIKTKQGARATDEAIRTHPYQSISLPAKPTLRCFNSRNSVLHLVISVSEYDSSPSFMTASCASRVFRRPQIGQQQK